MNSLERVNARLKGEPVDKIPNLNIFMSLVAKQAGVTYKEYVTDYRKLAYGNLRCAEKFGIDAVCVISDPMRETSAFGANITFPENGVPYSEPPLLASSLDLSKLTIADPHDSERTLDRIKAVELLRKEVGNEYPVIGWVEGVLAETADLRSVNNLLVDLMDEPPELSELMEIVHRQQLLFAKAQIDAGADIIGVGNAVASLVGPDLYKKFALDFDKATVDFIHGQGAKVKLHICGNITSLLGLIGELRADIVDIDWMVDFGEAVKAFSGKPTSASGNMDPVAVMLQGDEDTVREMVLDCIDKGDETTIIAAGCEVPAMTPEENLRLMDSLLYV
jgi:MtaA/CmuA family methyltransferase